MLRIITILLLLLACTSSSRAQTSDSVLLQYEHSYFRAENDSTRNLILMDKINYHLLQENLSEQVYLELKRIKPKFLAHDEQLSFYWNASLLYYISSNHYRALHYIEEFESASRSPNLDTSFQLLKYFIYAEYDTTISNILFANLIESDTSMNCLACISDVANFELKHKKFQILASYFIPGVGTMSAGKPVKGIISLSLNVLSAFAIIYTIQHQLWINTFGWGTNLIGKFYTGNIRLATKVIAEKEMIKKKELAQTCELQIRLIMQRYPLAFTIR